MPEPSYLYDKIGNLIRQRWIDRTIDKKSKYQGLPISAEYDLDNVIVRPDGSTLNNLKKVLPDKDLRHDFYRNYSGVGVSEADVAQNLYDLYNRAGKPTNSGGSVAVNFIGGLFGNSHRANYDPVFNTIHNPENRYTYYRDELSHALQFNDDRLKRYGLYRTVPSAAGNLISTGLGDSEYVDSQGNVGNNYDNPDSLENQVHSMIEPAVEKYIRSNGKNSYHQYLPSGGGVRAYGGPLVQTANVFEDGGTTVGPEAVITPDEEYNRFLNTLPDNQRLTPNEDYDTYLYWKLNGKPKNFQEALGKDMYSWDDSDKSYHGNSIAWGDDGTGYFIKPKHHDTLKYELDWFNKNIVTEEGGHQRFETPEERAESDKFRENYVLADDPNRPDFYIYKPKDQAEGLNTYKRWNDLSIKEKRDMMKVAISNGITNLSDIKDKYNEFAEGGNLYSGGGYVYDILPQLFAMDGVPVTVTSGYRPGAVVAGTNRLSRHARHEAVDLRGDFARMQQVLNNPNSNVARWMLANGYGYLNEAPTFGGTTKYWPKKYFKPDGTPDFHDHFHIGKDYGSKYAASFRGVPQQQQPRAMYTGMGWRNIAADNIMRHEGFMQHSYADAPKGKSWRSIGYGFNDSGFYNKYPMGISKYYDARGGITRAEAQQELNYMLDNMERQARAAYGSRWDQFNDNQKAAIMDTMYQRPASVLKGSQFHRAVMAGDPNAVNYLGVNGFDKRNADRRGLFGSPNQYAMQMPMQQPMQQMDQFAGWEPSNPQAFYGQGNSAIDREMAEKMTNMEATMKAYQEAQEQQQLAAARQAERQEKAARANLAWNFVMGMNGDSQQQSPYMGLLGALSSNAIMGEE